MADEHRILITGDRKWSDGDLIFEVLNRLPSTLTTVIDGKAPGADHLGNWNAVRLGMATMRFPAYWKCKDFEDDQGKPCKLDDGRHEAYHGRAAGVIRNQRMLEQSNPTEVWAFHDAIDQSSGTADMVRRAVKAKVLTTLYSHEHPLGIVL